MSDKKEFLCDIISKLLFNREINITLANKVQLRIMTMDDFRYKLDFSHGDHLIAYLVINRKDEILDVIDIISLVENELRLASSDSLVDVEKIIIKTITNTKLQSEVYKSFTTFR